MGILSPFFGTTPDPPKHHPSSGQGSPRHNSRHLDDSHRSRHRDDTIASANRKDGRPVAASRPRGEKAERYEAPPWKEPQPRQHRDSGHGHGHGHRDMVASTPHMRREKEAGYRRSQDRKRRSEAPVEREKDRHRGDRDGRGVGHKSHDKPSRKSLDEHDEDREADTDFAARSHHHEPHHESHKAVHEPAVAAASEDETTDADFDAATASEGRGEEDEDQETTPRPDKSKEDVHAHKHEAAPAAAAGGGLLAGATAALGWKKAESSAPAEDREAKPKQADRAVGDDATPRRLSQDAGPEHAHSGKAEKANGGDESGHANGGAATTDHSKPKDNHEHHSKKQEGAVAAGGAAAAAGAGAAVASKGSTNAKPHLKGDKYKMSGVSNMLLLMEDKSYHASCFSVYSFAQTLPYSTVRSFFHALSDSYPKYLYKIVGTGKKFRGAKWEYSPDFRVEENIEEVTLKDGHNGDHDFFKVMGKFIGRVYDYKKPPWEALLVQNMNLADGSKSALAIKIHHCFSDGQGMIMSYHTTLQALASKQDVSAIQRTFDAHSKKSLPIVGVLQKFYPGTLAQSWHDAIQLFFSPFPKEFRYADKKAKRKAGRLYCHSKGMRLADIKMIREAIKGVKGGNHISLNDVATALVTRAARRAAEKRAKHEGRKVKDKKFCLLIPISVRPKGNWELENFSTGALAWFDFRGDDKCGFEESLLQAHKEMKYIKNSNLPEIALYWFNKLYKYPWTFAPNWPGFKGFYYKIFSTYSVATNVPGPPKKIAFGGIEATSYQVLPPASSGKATMAIGMISYADEFKIAVSCDDEKGLRDLPRQLCEAFEEVAHEWIAEAGRRLQKRPEGQKMEGPKAEGQKAEGQKAEGQKAEGQAEKAAS